MTRSVLEIYAMSVCLIVVLWGATVVMGGAKNILWLAKPEWMAAAMGDNEYVTNEAFCERNADVCGVSNARHNINVGDGSFAALSAAKLEEEKYEQEQKEEFGPEAITRKRTQALQSRLVTYRALIDQGLIMEGVKIAVLSIVFFFHWRIGRKARSSQNLVKASHA